MEGALLRTGAETDCQPNTDQMAGRGPTSIMVLALGSTQATAYGSPLWVIDFPELRPIILGMAKKPIDPDRPKRRRRLTPEERRERGRKAVEARWAKARAKAEAQRQG